ncbi:MAG: DciA family protein [Candidatus Magasanikbacteria bacterium]|nr:DciA family protein [Candidatus Magasanikbacteria bacterium]
MDDLKGMIKARVQHSGVAASVTASLVVESTQKVFDEFFGAEPQLVRVLYLKNRTLTVSVSAAPVAQEVKKNEKQLLEKIRAAAADPTIERIRYLL